MREMRTVTLIHFSISSSQQCLKKGEKHIKISVTIYLLWWGIHCIPKLPWRGERQWVQGWWETWFLPGPVHVQLLLHLQTYSQSPPSKIKGKKRQVNQNGTKWSFITSLINSFHYCSHNTPKLSKSNKTHLINYVCCVQVTMSSARPRIHNKINTKKS